MEKILSRILFNLVDLFADLNKAEIESHENIDEWLQSWKKEVIRTINSTMKELENEEKYTRKNP